MGFGGVNVAYVWGELIPGIGGRTWFLRRTGAFWTIKCDGGGRSMVMGQDMVGNEVGER